MSEETMCHHGWSGEGCPTCRAERAAAAVFSPDRVAEHLAAARDALIMLRAIAMGRDRDSAEGTAVRDALTAIALDAATAIDLLDGIEAPWRATNGRGSKRGTKTRAVRKALGFTYP